MDLTLIILVAVIVLVVLYYFRRKGGSPLESGKSRSLRQEARRQLKLPPDQADQTIDRHIERLKARYPNRSEEWYLEKIIYDLERDR